jgi:hypothetical protein
MDVEGFGGGEVMPQVAACWISGSAGSACPGAIPPMEMQDVGADRDQDRREDGRTSFGPM